MSSWPLVKPSSKFNPILFGDEVVGFSQAVADSLYVGIGSSAYLTGLEVVGTGINTSALKFSGTTFNQSYYIGVTEGSAEASKALVLNSSKDITGLGSVSAATINGTTLVSGTACDFGSYKLNGVTFDPSSITEITAGTAIASKALVLNASKDIVGINSLSAATLTGTLSTAAQPAITSLGTLAANLLFATTRKIGLNGQTSPVATIDFGSVSSDRVIGLSNNTTTYYGFGANASQLRSLSPLHFGWYTGCSSTVLGSQVMSLTSAGLLTVASIGASLTTAAQPAITSAGTLSSLALDMGGVGINTPSLKFSGITFNQSYYISITAGGAEASKAIVLDSFGDTSGINALSTSTLNGTVLVSGTACDFGSFKLGGVSFDPSAITGVVAGTAVANSALVLDASRDITNINSISTTSLVLNGSSLSSADLGYLSGITEGTAAASKALVLDSGLGISGITTLQATNLKVYSTIGDRPLNFLTNNVAINAQMRWGATLTINNSITLGWTSASQRFSFDMYGSNNNLVIATTGTGVGMIPGAGYNLDVVGATRSATSLTSPLILNRNDAQVSGTRSEYLSIGRTSSASDHGAWSFQNYYQTVTQGTANYCTFGPALKTSLTTGWGICMNQNGQVSIQDSNTNGATGGYVTQANQIAALDVYGGLNRTIGGNGTLQNNATPAIYNGTGGTTRIGLYCVNAIWCADKVYASSDSRLKKDIEPIPLETARKLLNIQSVSYKWINKDADYKRDIGLIAQHLVAEDLNDLVSHVPHKEFEGGYSYGIAYDRLTVYLLELIKDQEKRISQLEKKK